MLQLVEAIHEIPFWTRAMALVCAFVIVGVVELALRRERAERWKEYAAWVAFAASGATFGAVNDLITSALFALVGTFDLEGVGPELARVLSQSEVGRFLLVQRAHFGAYAGALVGTVCAAFLIRRKRIAGSLGSTPT